MQPTFSRCPDWKTSSPVAFTKSDVAKPDVEVRGPRTSHVSVTSPASPRCRCTGQLHMDDSWLGVCIVHGPYIPNNPLALSLFNTRIIRCNIMNASPLLETHCDIMILVLKKTDEFVYLHKSTYPIKCSISPTCEYGRAVRVGDPRPSPGRDETHGEELVGLLLVVVH